MPRFLDFRKLRNQGGEVSGSMNLDQLPRLAEFCGDGEAPVEAALRFMRDDEGRLLIEGSVAASLQLTCQRCLQPLSRDVVGDVKLIVVYSEEQAKQLPTGWEPWFAESEQSDTAELLTEEILLAMPLVALHDDCRTPVDAAEPAFSGEPKADKENPFSVLAKLKKRQD